MMTALHPRCIEFPTAGHLCLGPPLREEASDE